MYNNFPFAGMCLLCAEENVLALHLYIILVKRAHSMWHFSNEGFFFILVVFKQTKKAIKPTEKYTPDWYTLLVDHIDYQKSIYHVSVGWYEIKIGKEWKVDINLRHGDNHN